MAMSFSAFLRVGEPCVVRLRYQGFTRRFWKKQAALLVGDETLESPASRGIWPICLTQRRKGAKLGTQINLVIFFLATLRLCVRPVI
ncbi:MAG: hypothetical protein HY289_15105 [Planctomycetes bacterium]|nr:hypothetical protein [Planctomycetota bacterium]